MTDGRDERIDDLRRRWAAAPSGGPEAARLAGALGRELFQRFFRYGGTDADRDEAIDRLDESLTAPHDPTVTHVGIAALLLFRALPIPIGADPDGSAALKLGMALMTGQLNTPERMADRTRSAAHLEWVVEHEPPEAEIRRVAEALIAFLRSDMSNPVAMLTAFANLPRLGGGLDELLDLARTWDGPAEPRAFAFDAVLRQLPRGHRLRPYIVAEAGALLAERGHVARLPRALAGLDEVILDSLDILGADDPLRDQTVRRLAGLLLTTAAYQGDRGSVAKILATADEMIATEGGDPVVAGKDRFLRAMALTLRGRLDSNPADLRAAVEDLQAAVRAVPPDDDLYPAVTGMLGALLHDRHLMQGVLANADAAQEVLAEAAANEPVAGLIGAMSRAMLAVQGRDRAALDAAVDELTAGLATLPDDYPWRSRLDAALGLVLLARTTVGGGPDDLSGGLALLHRAGDDLAAEMTGRPVLRAAGGLALLLEGLADGDAERVAEAAAALERLDDQDAPPSDRIGLAALRAEAAFARYERWGDPNQLGHAIEVLRGLHPDPGHPLAAHIAGRLALAHYLTGDEDTAIADGLVALRAYGNDTLLQAGAAHALEAGRRAGALSQQVTGWCLAAGRLDEALQAAELGRGLVLHATMTAARVPGMLRAGGHPDLAREWESRPAPGRALTGVIAQVLAGTPGLLSDLAPQVVTVLATGDRPVSVPNAAQIAVTLAATDTDALAYLLPGRTLLVTGTGEVSCLDAPRLRLDAPELLGYVAAHDARHSDDPDAPSWTHHLTRVCEWAWPALIEPLLAAGDAVLRTIVLIPGGVLGYVPWHAARSGDHYACEHFTFSYAASARQWRAAAGRPRTPEGRAVLVTDPAEPSDAREIELIAGLYPSVETIGTGGELLSELSTTPVVHVAAHAVAQESPANSHLLLSDGPLPASEILAAAHTRDAQAPGGLVVLSACTSDFTATAYDEALTLATAFLAAGATGVVGSRWEVRHEATTCLLFMFHRFRRERRLSDRDALRAAQLWMLDPGAELPAELHDVWRRRPARLADPSLWAAFTHHGS